MFELYDVYCVSGKVKHKLLSRRGFAECNAFCNEHDWVYDWNGGLVWDLEIEDSGWVQVFRDGELDDD